MTPGVRFFRLVGALGLGLVMGAGAADWHLWPALRVERVSVAGPLGRLAAKVWHPAGAAPSLGVLLCHGVETNKEVMDVLGVEFARRGALALTFDYGGYGESQSHDDALDKMVLDTRAAFLELRQRLGPKIPIVAIGHSMGATYAVEFAGLEPTLRAVVALGNEPVARQVPPNNVLYAMGAFDVFHSLDEMLATARESARNAALAPNALWGRFENGSARALATSPWTDHGPEPMDPLLIERSLEWVARAVPQAHLESGSAWRESLRVRLHVLALGGLFMAVLAGLVLLREAGWHSKVMSRSYLGAAVVLGGLGFLFPVLAVPLWADLALAVLAAGMVAAALWPEAGLFEEVPRRMVRWFAMAGLLSLCLLLGVLAVGMPGALRLGYGPVVWKAVLGIASLRPCEGLCMLRSYAFWRYSTGAVPGVGLGVVLVAEALSPGWLLRQAASAVESLVRAVRLDGPVRLHTSRKSLAVAAAVGAVLVWVVYRRIQEGWLDWESAARMASIAMRGLLLPLVLFIAVVNLVTRRRSD